MCLHNVTEYFINCFFEALVYSDLTLATSLKRVRGFGLWGLGVLGFRGLGVLGLGLGLGYVLVRCAMNENMLPGSDKLFWEDTLHGGQIQLPL